MLPSSHVKDTDAAKARRKKTNEDDWVHRTTQLQGQVWISGYRARGIDLVGQAVGGGCQSGWGRLLSVINAVEVGAWRQGNSGWA